VWGAVFGALVWYIDEWWSGGFVLLYLAALGSKEMAVTLPAMAFVYDLLYRPPFRARETLRRLGPAALVSVLFVVWKVAGPGKMIENPDCRPHFTWSAFMAGWQHYSFDLFYGFVVFSAWRIVLLWGLLIAIAALVRRREVTFAVAFLFIGILPVAFLTPRGFFAIYLTLPGWYLFGAGCWRRVDARRSFRRRRCLSRSR
jgi:hypothetical protein